MEKVNYSCKKVSCNYGSSATLCTMYHNTDNLGVGNWSRGGTTEIKILISITLGDEWKRGVWLKTLHWLPIRWDGIHFVSSFQIIKKDKNRTSNTKCMCIYLLYLLVRLEDNFFPSRITKTPKPSLFPIYKVMSLLCCLNSYLFVVGRFCLLTHYWLLPGNHVLQLLWWE